MSLLSEKGVMQFENGFTLIEEKHQRLVCFEQSLLEKPMNTKHV